MRGMREFKKKIFSISKKYSYSDRVDDKRNFTSI